MPRTNRSTIPNGREVSRMHDVIESDDGQMWAVGEPLAYLGREGCRDARCRRDSRHPNVCMGWHCPTCHEPTSYQGHDCPVITEA